MSINVKILPVLDVLDSSFVKTGVLYPRFNGVIKRSDKEDT